MYTNHIVVIGAGASGLMAAISAAGRLRETASSTDVILLEHNDRAGRKILQTGNGRCNLTNTYINPKCYQNDNTDFVMNIIREFTPDNTIEFFNTIGVLTRIRSMSSKDANPAAGYVYPHSDQASTVADSLTREAQRLGVVIIYEADVTGISAAGDSGSAGLWEVSYKLNDELRSIRASKVIIAAGSKASPKSGSDGSGYRLARQLGHRIIRPLPALVQLESSCRLCKNIAGVRQDAAIRLESDSGVTAKARGEIQFTDYGCSGIPVFQVSRHAVRDLSEGREVTACIDLLPDMTTEHINAFIRASAAHNSQSTLLDVIAGMLNMKLAKAMLDSLGIKYRFLACNCNERDINVISHLIKEFRMQLTGYKSFENAQICIGGVSLEDVNGLTLESKLAHGIYFCGEILDVDGICGGYNLQWAWSSGHLAGIMAAQDQLRTERRNQ